VRLRPSKKNRKVEVATVLCTYRPRLWQTSAKGARLLVMLSWISLYILGTEPFPDAPGDAKSKVMT